MRACDRCLAVLKDAAFGLNLVSDEGVKLFHLELCGHCFNVVGERLIDVAKEPASTPLSAAVPSLTPEQRREVVLHFQREKGG
jgi:hypothetical protein